MPTISTLYYRQNRASRKIVYQCPHCDYETANSKIQLTNHIHAKHTEEKDRPYKCTHCPRGFAQQAHLDAHLDRTHDVQVKRPKISHILYFIEPAGSTPKSKKTKARFNYYKRHGCISSKDINSQLHEYLPGVFLKKHDVHYDNMKGFIALQKCQVHRHRKCLSCKRPRFRIADAAV